jgi:nucleoside-diphosphate-sugar epimerase
MVCFTPDSATQLLDALRGTGARLLMCGTIWTHGTLTAVPALEHEDRTPWGEYGIGKAAIEDLILAEADRDDRVPSAILHPGHISGPGWPVINPAANLDPDVWRKLATGERLVLPDLGLETVHHVHADDVAQAFQLAVDRPEGADGRAFHVVSERALTLRGFAEHASAWWGREADLAFLPFDVFRKTTTPEYAATTWDHAARSHSVSIAAARQHLGYAPRFTSLETARESVTWLAQQEGSVIPPLLA